MYGRRYLSARTRYRCEWKCRSCGRMNRERGEVRSHTHMRASFHDDMEITGELVQENSRKKFFRLQEAVNEMRWLSGLTASGVCRKCGRRQFWAPSRRHAWACVAAVGCLGGLVCLSGWPEEELLLPYLCAAGFAALAAEYVSLRVTRWRLRRMAEQDCAPWLSEWFPEK